MAKYLKLMAWVCVALSLSACSNSTQSGEKIAVIKWEKAVKAHPEYSRLQQGEKIVKNLKLRKDAQIQVAKSQMDSLERLRALKKLSEQSYYEAELHTQLVEKDQINKAKLYRHSFLVQKQVEMMLKPQRKAVEDEYRLRIFNLRMEKDRSINNVRFREREKLPEVLAGIDDQIAALKLERDARLTDLELSRQGLIADKMEPYAKNLQSEVDKFAQAKKKENQAHIDSQEGKYDRLLSAAPEALNKAVALMDQEIETQKSKNQKVEELINKDIEGAAVKLAKERGYSIVFNTFKANVSAADITDDIVAELKKVKK